MQPLSGRTGWLQVVVIATDQGQEPLSDRTNVFIHVQDVNDHKPVIYIPDANVPIPISEVNIKKITLYTMRIPTP